MDDVKVFDKEADKIQTGFYFIESQQYMPFRHNGWYSDVLINYGLENNLITKENIKYQLTSSLELSGDFFNGVIEEFIKMPYGMDKAGTNFLLGLFNKLTVEINKMVYSTSFANASTLYMNNDDGKHFLETEKIGDKKVYVVKSSENYSSDYFTNVIYHQVLDVEAMELHKLKTIIKKNGGHVTHLSTDCCECWFNKNRKLDISKYFWDNDKTILKYRYDEKDEPPTYERKKKFVHCSGFYINNQEWDVINDPMDDNFSGLAEEIIDSNQSYNLDGIAGAGKTTLLNKITERLDASEVKYFALAPTNKACRKLGKKCMTIHKFLSIGFENKKNLEKAIEHIDYFIIDEISMVKEIFYSIFLTMKRMKPTLKFIICGDWRQLEPVNDRAKFDYKNSRALYELCSGNRLELTKCRRSDDELYQLSLDVLNGTNIKDKTGKESCDLCICFTNKKWKQLNEKWML